MSSHVVCGCVAIALAGCGAVTSDSAAAGCQGLPTPKQSPGFLVVSGALHHASRREVCARLGPPRNISRDANGLITWWYGLIGQNRLAFKGDRVVAAYR